MFRIVKFPVKLEPFFTGLELFFHWDHFTYFRTLTLLFAFAWGRRNISNLYRYIDSDLETCPHRTRFNDFLLVARWDPAAALRQKTQAILKSLKPQPGEVLYLIIDSSAKKKSGKHMEGVSKIKDTNTGAYYMGHTYIEAIVHFRNFIIPSGMRLYVKPEECLSLDIVFYKLTQWAAQLIREFEAPEGIKVVVLFDSFFLCPVVLHACRDKGFRFISTLKSNRNLFKGGRKLKTGKYGRNLFRRGSKTGITLPKEAGGKTYQFIDVGWIQVSKVGLAHVVFSRRGQSDNILGLITDDPDLSAKKIIQYYDGRWEVEVFNKEVKQHLGLGQYQNLPYEAAVKHLHLVCFAYALLTHLAIMAHDEKGKRKSAARIPVSSLQNELRRMVWDDLAKHLKELPDGNAVIKELGRLLVA